MKVGLRALAVAVAAIAYFSLNTLSLLAFGERRLGSAAWNSGKLTPVPGRLLSSGGGCGRVPAAAPPSTAPRVTDAGRGAWVVHLGPASGG